MNKIPGSFFFAFFFAFSPTILAQQPAAADQTPTIRHTVQEVLLQVVVHDSRGRIVKNLKPNEIEVYENGVRQQIRSFKLISGRDVVVKNTEAKRAAPAVVAPSNPLKAVNLICIVFTNLDPYTKKYAVDAAREFLNSQIDPDTWVAVFNLDTKLHVLQAFTTNRNDVIDAANKAFTSPTVDFAQVATAVLNAAPNMVTMEATATGVGGHAGAVAETATVTGGEANTNVFVGADVAT